MKTICLLLVTFCLVGCGKENDLNNPYYDRMKKLADEAKANPNDKTALHKLEKYTTDSDYWNRSYACGFLGDLAFKNIGGCQAELIPYFDNALKDVDYGVRQAGVQAIVNIGSPAVEKSLPQLINMVQQGKENDITWSATDALGKLDDPTKAQGVLRILLKAANTPPPEGTQDEAPQIRYEALDSIKELAKKNGLNAVPQLESLLNESKSPYKERVAKAILKLDPNNQVAHKVLDAH